MIPGPSKAAAGGGQEAAIPRGMQLMMWTERRRLDSRLVQLTNQ
jgi:hypothetical protein